MFHRLNFLKESMVKKKSKELEKPVNAFSIEDLAIDEQSHNDVKMAKHTPTLREEIEAAITDVPDFPKKGILFKDITTFLHNGKLFSEYIAMLANRYQSYKIEYVVGIEARGFILGSALAYALQAGFVPIRKKGKLPGKILSQSYSLEYGKDSIEIKDDAFAGIKGVNVILIDDLIATGGTANAALKLITKLEAKCIEFPCLINLTEFSESKERKELESKTHIFPLIDVEPDSKK
ncbi:adenine phosphoribosyltransferase [Helicobacter saguini]|uniref:Adenine phosphoribosyltransferase n=2 Tax=Helicobacter saguini TaxID=1548018 RepID=A0A347VGL9_9HELI|nr:adenine phosphoribosyltransferase [Helicobacter saguini]MWV67377.1 adenine phosphoribosyltransferase [Helicobacter saguini]MWV69730.1 adenine phosphoribosyltransferase [Helicobacter saguini]TLD95573.1 adenine phosphoribosyltransferase [Helicobacter saguini]